MRWYARFEATWDVCMLPYHPKIWGTGRDVLDLIGRALSTATKANCMLPPLLVTFDFASEHMLLQKQLLAVGEQLLEIPFFQACRRKPLKVSLLWLFYCMS